MDQELGQKRKMRGWDLAFGLGMLAIFCLYLYKLPLGGSGPDEGFYLTIPQRLLQGDVFFVDEWHGSQLHAFLTAPILALRNLFFPTGEGIILQWRYCYLGVHSLVCLAMYLRLRRDYTWSAAAGVLVLYLFTPYDITALCYNTLGLDMIALTAALAVTAKGKGGWLAAGVTFAAGVLCTPHLALLYALGSLAALGYALWAKRREIGARWLAFTGGCALLALALAGFVLSRADLGEVVQAIPNLLGDPEHQPVPLVWKLIGAVRGLGLWKLPLGADLLILAAAALDRNRRRHPLPYVAGMCAMSLVMYLQCIPELLAARYHYLLFPLVPLGALALLLSRRRDRRVFCFFWLGGLGYAFCVHMGSNQGEYILTCMSVVPALGSVLLLGGLVRELEPKWSYQKGVAASVAACLCLQVGLMTYVKVNHKFWDSQADNRDLTATVESGPWAGLKVTQADAETYTRRLETLRAALADKPPGRLLCASDQTWYYLEFPQMTMGAFSGWLSGHDSTTVDRLCGYYQANPDHVPDYIYLPYDEGWDLEDVRARLGTPNGLVATEAGGVCLFVRQDLLN